MPLQVQIAQTSDVTSLPVQALIVPIVSWEDYTSQVHELLRARTNGYYHELLGNLMRHGLHTTLPVILFKDDRPARVSQLEYVAFVFMDEHLDEPYVAYQRALRLLSTEGVTTMAMGIPIGVRSSESYVADLKRLRYALEMQRLVAPHDIARLLLAVDCGEAMRLAAQNLNHLQCANAKYRKGIIYS